MAQTQCKSFVPTVSTVLGRSRHLLVLTCATYGRTSPVLPLHMTFGDPKQVPSIIRTVQNTSDF